MNVHVLLGLTLCCSDDGLNIALIPDLSAVLLDLHDGVYGQIFRFSLFKTVKS